MPCLWAKPQLKIVKQNQRVCRDRCRSDTGIRDLTIPRTLFENFDHTDCGVYAEVVTPGEIAVGDSVRSEGR
jgi:MOSC domain-containing protein YiiM